MSDARAAMDAIYRVQRHFYDVTRKPWLLGRDALIEELDPPAGATILEIGCGTGRNLIVLARRHPDVACFGVDVSGAMLRTATRSIARAGLSRRVHVARADATAFDPDELFGHARFDRVFVSYALSMIPAWAGVLEAAEGLTAENGSLHVVDFGAQRGLPRPIRLALNAWLARFSVSPRHDLRERCELIAARRGRHCETRDLYRGFAVLARVAPLAVANK